MPETQDEAGRGPGESEGATGKMLQNQATVVFHLPWAPPCSCEAPLRRETAESRAAGWDCEGDGVSPCCPEGSWTPSPLTRKSLR